MNVQEVQKWVTAIEEFKASGALVEAKELEYRLFFDVLTAIGEGQCVNPEGCAELAASVAAILVELPPPPAKKGGGK